MIRAELCSRTYDCTDTTETVVSVGSAGTLTLTNSGSVLTAALAGDDYVGGTFAFDQVSDNAAIATDGQTVGVVGGSEDRRAHDDGTSKGESGYGLVTV